MKRNVLFALCYVGIAAVVISCGSSKGDNTNKVSADVGARAGVLTVDQIFDRAEGLVGQQVELEGVCTHRCAHSGLRIFLMGSDDTKTIRVESASREPFDARCARNVVKVTGVLREQRIDEAYLANWEKQVANKTAEEHGKGAAGCSSEKKSRNERGNTVQERIADFRQQISERMQAEGKAYLSFYYVDGEGYTIQTPES